MCRCTPEIRTPFCGRGDCLPPASREPTESLFAANAEREFARMAHGDHLAQFKADQLDAWERRLAQFSNRSDSTGYVGRIGVEVLTELRQSREQAEALATALDEQDAVRVTPYEVDLAVKMFNRNGGRWESESDEELVMKWEWRKRNAIELAIVALRAYREATP